MLVFFQPLMIQNNSLLSNARYLSIKQNGNVKQTFINPLKLEYETHNPKHSTQDIDSVPPLKRSKSNSNRKRMMAPSKWKEIYSQIVEMRQHGPDTPVDTMGCHTLGDTNLSVEDWRFQILVGLVLSSQTKDPVTAAAMEVLKAHGLSVESIINTPVEDINTRIQKVGFHNKKAQYIKDIAMTLKSKHDGKVPDSLSDLLALKGVGAKMAHLVLQVGFNRVEGISVDTHVHRISRRIGFTLDAKTPEQTRLQLQEWLPKPLWKEINALLVGFGQSVCTPIKPKCGNCKVGKLCPSFNKSG